MGRARESELEMSFMLWVHAAARGVTSSPRTILSGTAWHQRCRHLSSASCLSCSRANNHSLSLLLLGAPEVPRRRRALPTAPASPLAEHGQKWLGGDRVGQGAAAGVVIMEPQTDVCPQDITVTVLSLLPPRQAPSPGSELCPWDDAASLGTSWPQNAGI